MLPEVVKTQHQKHHRFFTDFFTKNTPQEDPKIHQKSVKMGEGHWGIALFEAKNTQNINFDAPSPILTLWEAILEPPGTILGAILDPLAVILDAPGPINTATNPDQLPTIQLIWPGGMREAIE